MIGKARSKTLVALVTPIMGLGILAGASLAAETEQFTLVERAASDSVVDVGEEGDSAGDMLTFANEIFDEANETKVGTNNGYCIRTVVGVGWECTFSIALADGQLNIEGPFLESGDSVMSVIGGTGKYTNASGEMGLQLHDDTGTAYDFIFTISY